MHFRAVVDAVVSVCFVDDVGARFVGSDASVAVATFPFKVAVVVAFLLLLRFTWFRFFFAV